MLGHVAARSIAAFLVLLPHSSGGQSGASADPILPATINASASRPQVAALDPAMPALESPGRAAAMPSPSFGEPFGLKTVPITDGDILTKWRGVEADISAESAILARCRVSTERCPSVAKTFLAIIAAGRKESGRARIGVINRAINLAIRPMSDLAQWGVIDRWSAPLDTFTTGRGDCEDYAIAKYVALREAGLAEADVRLVIVRDLASKEDHAVVSVRLDAGAGSGGGGWIVLDNRWLTLVEDNEMPRIAPMFVLDQTGVKMFWPSTAPMPPVPAVASRSPAPAALASR
jgi:predicted transglutaminase-like cysteine proteinase